MTIKIIYNYNANPVEDWSIEKFDNIKKIEYEDQRMMFMDNGTWLHLEDEKHIFSIEFNPKKDVFVITK